MITNSTLRKKLAQWQIARDNKSQGKNDESLILELQLYQEQLEMQNLELREAQQALEASRDRYADLYDFAPVGYVSLTEAGIIKEINLTAANLLGKPRPHLLEYHFSCFVLAAERHRFYHHLRHCQTEGWACTELSLLGKNGPSHQVQLYSTQVQDHTYGRLCRTVITDITQLKQAEEALRISETKYRKLFEEAIDGIGLADLETGLIIDCNPALARMVQRETSELIGQSQKILHPPEEHAGPVSWTFELHRTGKKDSVLEAKIITKTGEIREVEIKANIVRLEDREVVQGIFRDITERKRAEQALFEEKKRAQITLHSIGDGVITIDAHAIVNYLNPTAEALTGWTMAEACGRHLNEIFHLVNEQMQPLVSNPVVRCLREGKIIDLAYQSILINRHGQEYYIEVTAASMRGQNGQVLGAVLALHDATETRRLTRQLEYDATHDALTGLINRAEFERRLERALASAQQYGARHALCYLDLDQFKIINDTAGHTAGDALLKKIHTLLSDRFRERDTLARLGGDEFGLLLDNCPLDRAQVIAQAIVASIRKYRFNWEGHTYQIGVSIGLVPITAEAQGTAQLLTQADIACYTAKELGRNRVHVYQREDSETIQRHSEILGAVGLRNALEQGRFQLYYQPIFPLNTPDLRPVR
ncbi:MAG TPA: PAS domain S-box protein, partial [Candidatus Competibacteraceae bacterium]|nr:PAS domain S-box protein [Candidatus Competibacteraceae bacterium]